MDRYQSAAINMIIKNSFCLSGAGKINIICNRRNNAASSRKSSILKWGCILSGSGLSRFDIAFELWPHSSAFHAVAWGFYSHLGQIFICILIWNLNIDVFPGMYVYIKVHIYQCWVWKSNAVNICDGRSTTSILFLFMMSEIINKYLLLVSSKQHLVAKRCFLS